MLEFPGAAYRDIAGLAVPGNKQDPEELALLAIGWVVMNREFIRTQVPDEDGFDYRDVVSLLMFRAYKGGGLVQPLKAHADGSAPVSNLKSLLLRHVAWAAGECRKVAWTQRETATDWCDTATPAAPGVWDPQGNPDGYLELISILAQDCDDSLATEAHNGTWRDRLQAVKYVTGHLPGLMAIFRRYAPTSVSADVAGWDEDSRSCVLLAIFPAQLPHRAVTTYRQMTLGTGRSEITVEATQRKISRLRSRLRGIWPPDLVPPGIRGAKSRLHDDDSSQEVS